MDFGPITLDHIGIATPHLDDASPFWRLIGLVQGSHDEIVEDQGVATRFFSTNDQADRTFCTNGFEHEGHQVVR